MRIGIITMHRVLNYGSALQAYALQHYIERKIGGDVQLIDYVYPNKEHMSELRSHMSIIGRIHSDLAELRDYILGGGKQRQKRFDEFYRTFFHLSEQKYKSMRSINQEPPMYDIYITGSDQVWNVNTMGNDLTYYLDFTVDNAKRISFGSSFAIKTPPVNLRGIIKKSLARYSAIGLRESTGTEFVKSLNLSKQINIVTNCDPTLLLNAEDYKDISTKSIFTVEKDYILVYYLGYAFDPQPAISTLTQKISDLKHYDVILLGRRQLRYKNKILLLNNIGPCEFVWLFQHAKYVITSSFHGTMFSVIFRRPFYSIIPRHGVDDSRIIDFLNCTHLTERAIEADADISKIEINENVFSHDSDITLKSYVRKSEQYLKKNLQII